jgi:antirestriction protein ArdC
MIFAGWYKLSRRAPHKSTHWTSPPGRCDRNLFKRFGKAERAAEELVAEIGAAFLCAELGVTQDMRPDHAADVANWLKNR